MLLFGAYALVDGVFAIIAGIRAAERHERWWPFALEGLLSILVGVIAFVMPAAAALALLYFVSAWAILTGVLRISAAIRLRKEIRGEWMLILNGALSVLLGILIVVRPGAGVVTLMWGSARTRWSTGSCWSVWRSSSAATGSASPLGRAAGAR